MTTQEKKWAEGLAERLRLRAIDISAGHAHVDESPAVRRAMRLIYLELGEMIRGEVMASGEK